MATQLFFDDVTDGQEIPSLVKSVNTVNINMYCAVVWLMDRIHFDYPFSVERRGLPNVVAPGNMACDYYAQMLTDWAGEQGSLSKLQVQFREFMLPGNTLTCGGRVTRLTSNSVDGGTVELDLWIRNEEGATCVPGSAVVLLPTRNAA